MQENKFIRTLKSFGRTVASLFTFGKKETPIDELGLLWVLNLSDGQNSLLDIANRSAISFPIIKKVADLLLENGLLKEAELPKKGI